MEQQLDKGMLSIESKNIFSILKKWLYTEQDIVFRELISNAADAIEKRQQLAECSEAAGHGEICVTLDQKTQCLIIQDNGIGMSMEEVDTYINTIAFSGAEEFIQQHNQQDNGTIIGHFGVGFYSAFMLADHVAIETKSMREAAAVRWDCQADMSYQMGVGAKQQAGTEVILYLNDASSYLQRPEIVFNSIKKYFAFSKIPIYFDAPGYDHVVVNNPDPIWKRGKETIQPAEMITFYKEYFQEAEAPVFWLQFESVDIGVKGILFFRDTKQGTEELDGTVKVYSRGVYIGENIQEMIPKFVNLQHGIIECDYLPLVVSRASIRDEASDDMVALIHETLSQEVTIALNDLFTNQRATYEAYWPEINAFVKYGILQDKIFASVMSRKIIFEDIYGNYQTVQEYIEQMKETQGAIVYYASDKLDQAHYIDIFRKCQLNALLFDHVIDQPLLYKQEVLYTDCAFMRIDSNIEAIFSRELTMEEQQLAETIHKKFVQALGERLGSIELQFTSVEQTDISSIIINDEQSRRMTDMMEIYGLLNPVDFSTKEKQNKSKLLINLKNETVQFVGKTSKQPVVDLVIHQLFDLALLSQQALRPEDTEQFMHRSEAILQLAIENK